MEDPKNDPIDSAVKQHLFVEKKVCRKCQKELGPDDFETVCRAHVWKLD
jgi:ribosomal protein L40E